MLRQRLGPYDLLEPVGAGAMGQVYRARDSRLGRDVAIKMLLATDRDDAELIARFEREAQALAALNHPHIASIHDVVEAGGQRGIVMEFVAGRTLRDLMSEGPLPTRQALGYAIQICDALAAAHAAGIVHRDLKPANVIVTGAGAVKVLDFGIAKLVSADQPATADANTQAPLTAERMVVGTAGYMSPEQVHGRALDARSDIFSLGVLLYEMVTGTRAFDGESTAGLLSAVLRDDPAPLRAINPSVPRSVERITLRCLEKDPGQRYQTAADLKRALEDARDDLTTLVGTEPAPANASPPSGTAHAPAGHGRWRVLTPLGYVAAGVVGAALAGVAAGAFRPPVILTPRHAPLVTEQAGATAPAWAPDGRSLAYLAMADGAQQLFVRSLDAEQPTQLTRGSNNIQGGLGWSPDGTRVYFYRDGDLSSVGVAGGEPAMLVRGPGAGFAVHPDGRTLVAASGSAATLTLSVVDVGTAEARTLDRPGLPAPLVNVGSLAFSPDGAMLAMTAGTMTNSPQGLWIIPWREGVARAVPIGSAIDLGAEQGLSWMPDGRRVVLNANPADETTSRLFIVETASGSVQQITGGANSEVSPSVSPDGSRIAFVSQRLGRDLLALPVDGSPPQPVLQSSRNESFPDMSASGALAYVTDAYGWPAVGLRRGTDAWSRRMGRHIANVAQVRLSPDDQRLSVDDVSSSEHAIMIHAVAGGAPVRLDRESTDQHGASWSPDGNWLAYRRLMKDRWQLVKAPVGGGAAVVLAEMSPDNGGGGATDWSATGRWIGHTMQDGGVHLVAADGTERRVLAGPRPAAFRFSRDGARMLAVRRGQGRRWELATWDVGSGRELRVVALPLAASTEVQGMALSVDESQVVVGAGTPTSDIWLLEQFEPPVSGWRRWMGR